MIGQSAAPLQQSTSAATDVAAQRPRARLILVPLDGSVEAKVALPAARLAARIVQASVHVVHVTDHPLSPDELLRRVNLTRNETRGIVIDQAVGDPAETVVQLAETMNAMLIAMSTRGHTAYRGRTVRPVVERVILRACAPILLVRPEICERVAATTRLRRLLLPLDGAPSSASVIGPALELAQRSGAAVDILYVATQAPRPEEPGTMTTPRYVDQPQHEWPLWAREFVSRFGTCFGKHPPTTPTRMFLRSGDPASEILRFCSEQDCDLIVLEWRGRFDPAHARVVRHVLTDAPCPVLLLRTRCDGVSK